MSGSPPGTSGLLSIKSRCIERFIENLTHLVHDASL